jgi:peroxiredoxin
MVRGDWAVVAVVVGLLAAGCGSDGGSTTGTPATTPAVPSTAAAPSPAATASPSGQAATVPQTLTFTATTVDGKTFDAATLAGKPVVFWFWAAWCPRCRAAADDVAAVHRDFTGKVTVVGVAGLDSGEDAMRSFVSDRGIAGFTNLADDQGAVWRRFEVTTQEYYVLLDSAGKVVHKGPLTQGALRDRVTALAG